LSSAGDQEPVIELREVVGNATKLPPLHIGGTAVKVGAKLVAILTVTFTKQPLLSVYVIEVIPVDSPVTNPVELTVATAVSEEVQGVTAFGTPEPTSCEVLPLQKVSVPVIVGLLLTVMVKVVVKAHCPVLGVKV
jgi:hypothetical protein